MAKKLKKTEENIEMYNPKTQYRSTEKKIQDWAVNASKKTAKNIADFTRPTRQSIARGAKHTKEFTGEFIPYFTQTGTSIWRIPTIVRKNNNKQLRIQLQDQKGLTKAQKRGSITGYIAGATVALAQSLYALGTAAEGDFSSLLALGASNTASGFYESGRIDKSKREKNLQKINIEPRRDE